MTNWCCCTASCVLYGLGLASFLYHITVIRKHPYQLCACCYGIKLLCRQSVFLRHALCPFQARQHHVQQQQQARPVLHQPGSNAPSANGQQQQQQQPNYQQQQRGPHPSAAMGPAKPQISPPAVAGGQAAPGAGGGPMNQRGISPPLPLAGQQQQQPFQQVAPLQQQYHQQQRVVMQGGAGGPALPGMQLNQGAGGAGAGTVMPQQQQLPQGVHLPLGPGSMPGGPRPQ